MAHCTACDACPCPTRMQLDHTRHMLPDKLSAADSSLLFAMELVDGEDGTQRSGTAGYGIATRAQMDQLSFLLCPASAFQDRLQRDVANLLHLERDMQLLASRLAMLGYDVILKSAIGGGPACFKNLRHEFITVVDWKERPEVHYIVDPLFKEQFELSKPSATYSAILRLLPQEFVGTAQRLIPLVQCMCAEMAASFESQGLALPPWRRAQAMLSKWLPARSQDVAYFSGSSNAGNNSSNRPDSSCISGVSPCSSPSECAAGRSPFSRLTEADVGSRVCRSKSLLSNKLSTALSCRNMNTACAAGGSIRSNGSSATMDNRAVFGYGKSQQRKQHQSGTPAAQSGGLVRLESAYRGQPPTYKVKMGSALQR